MSRSFPQRSILAHFHGPGPGSRLFQPLNWIFRRQRVATSDSRVLLIETLKVFWQGFSTKHSNSDRGHRPSAAGNDHNNSITAPELVRVLEATQSYLEETGLSMQDIYGYLTKAVDSVQPYELNALFMPFAELILNRQVPFTLGGGELATEAASLATHIISRYILGYEQPDPTAPQNFSLATSITFCSCRDCSAVNAFLRSPTETVGQFPLSRQRRFHLHKQFTDRARASGYAVTTLRDTYPKTWQITKSSHVYKIRREAWKRGVARAQATLQRMDGAEQRLKPFFREWYPSIMRGLASVRM